LDKPVPWRDSSSWGNFPLAKLNSEIEPIKEQQKRYQTLPLKQY